MLYSFFTATCLAWVAPQVRLSCSTDAVLSQFSPKTSVNSGIQYQLSPTLNPLLDCTLPLMNQDLTMNSNLATKLQAGTQQSLIFEGLGL